MVQGYVHKYITKTIRIMNLGMIKWDTVQTIHFLSLLFLFLLHNARQKKSNCMENNDKDIIKFEK